MWLGWVLFAAHRIFSCGLWDLVPRQGWNQELLHWELRVLATGPSGKSLRQRLCVAGSTGDHRQLLAQLLDLRAHCWALWEPRGNKISKAKQLLPFYFSTGQSQPGDPWKDRYLTSPSSPHLETSFRTIHSPGRWSRAPRFPTGTRLKLTVKGSQACPCLNLRPWGPQPSLSRLGGGMLRWHSSPCHSASFRQSSSTLGEYAWTQCRPEGLKSWKFPLSLGGDSSQGKNKNLVVCKLS